MFIISVLLVLIPLISSQRYRLDYVYNAKTNAFYNLHIESRDKWRAEKVCKAEGASLMDPESDLDVAQFHAMFKRYPDLGAYAWVKDDGREHEPAAEKVFVMGETDEPRELGWSRRCDVLTREGEIETYQCALTLPFICKVDAKDAYYDNNCRVYSNSYQYIQDLGSCYKVSQIAYTWNEAYAECQKEGAHLVVLNSEAEHQAVWNMTKGSYVHDAKAHFFFFAGFRADRPLDGKPREFRTIFNQSLQEAGYAEWSENEPNNALNNEDCGSIFKNDGKLNDLDCTDNFAFICEKEKLI